MRTQQLLTRVAGGAPAKPQQIPAKGWLDILLRVKEQLTTDSSWPLRWRYGARKGIVALITAANVAYDEDEGRGFFKQLLISLAFTLGMVSELRSIRCLFPCT